MNVIDSSAWLEYFADGPNAADFARAIEDIDSLIVPSLTIFEVFKRILQQSDETAALRATAAMQQGQVVELDATLAINAAKLSHDLGLPLADSIILATAKARGAVLWTQDGDFEGMTEVEFRKKK